MMRAAQDLQRMQTAKQLLLSGVQCVSSPTTQGHGHQSKASNRNRTTDRAGKVHSIDWWVNAAEDMAEDVIKRGKRVEDAHASGGVRAINRLFLQSPSGK